MHYAGSPYTYNYSQCHAKRSLGWVGASQTFFWHDNDNDLKTYLCMTQLLIT